jgi:Holliday junction resolvase-like predicted endonuclease
MRRLAEAGEMLLASHPGAERLRFDVITVDGLRITHIPAAF